MFVILVRAAAANVAGLTGPAPPADAEPIRAPLPALAHGEGAADTLNPRPGGEASRRPRC